MEDWLSRWEQGRTGWHEANGNQSLREYWPELPAGSRVLVPLCGKTPDLLWLAKQGLEVTGIEMSEIAIRAFYDENSITHEVRQHGNQQLYGSTDPTINLIHGDYFEFTDQPFDALYDRGSLIALPPQIRPAYIRHTQSLLVPDATQLLITLEYDDTRVGGPPFCVQSDEVRSYWPNLERVVERNDIDNCPPKFRNAGLSAVTEAIWTTP